MCTLTFGERLTDLRLSAGLSQKELAVVLGVSESTIRSYENGRFCPPMSVLLRMGAYFHVTLDYLAAISDFNLRIDSLEDIYTVFNDEEISVGKLIERQISLDRRSRIDLYEMIDALIKGGKLKQENIQE